MKALRIATILAVGGLALGCPSKQVKVTHEIQQTERVIDTTIVQPSDSPAPARAPEEVKTTRTTVEERVVTRTPVVE